MRFISILVTILLGLMVSDGGWLTGGLQGVEAGSNTPTGELEPVLHGSFLPLVSTDASPAIQWDPRLTERGAELVPAEVVSGEGYWRLVKAMWYDENEPPFEGQHHILVDTLDTAGERQMGVPILVRSIYGPVDLGTIYTERKPGELYAANWPMWEVAPCYSATPADGVPADGVTNMGMGSVGLPTWKIHTSYGLVWQWTVAR